MSDNDLHVRAFVRELRSRNLSPRTVTSYVESVNALRTWTADEIDLADINRDQMRDFLSHLIDTYAPATAAIRYRSLQQFFKWAVADEMRYDNPMTGMTPPQVPEQPVAILTIPQVKALLSACSGKGFEDRRDTAIVRLFLEPGGMRLSELAALSLAAVDLDEDAITVLGKGRRERAVPFGSKTGTALERYVRLRGRHPWATLPNLWLGGKGPLTISGVQQMLRRRAAQARIGHIYPHMLRHTAAHEWLNSGGQETDAMRLFGWRSRQMLQRYGASAADERARDAAKRMRLGDRY